ncbi:MAG: inorganic phosphate transporter [Candidatus Methanomethyliaceae archaeon]|nr:inorganic phosphate transporter [Candidatus Methanomethyliaceae archaeon]MDW7971533.1 anion permease [Nitrososphaerota archaeon]
MELIFLVMGLMLSFIMAMNIGGNDAANPTSVAVGSGTVSLRKALLLFAIFTILGAVLQGHMVMKTIGRGVVSEIDILGAFIIVLSANIWIFFATMRGMAISTTHSIVSAVIGYGLLKYGISGINFNVIFTILISWITSPLCSFSLSMILFYLLKSIIKDSFEKFFKIMIIFALAFSAYSFGANDVANASGVYITIASKLGNMPDMNAMFILSLFSSLGIIMGGVIFGHRVIRTLAFRITRFDITSALAAGLANALVVYLFTVIPYMIFGYGMPISTSYAAVGAILGAGAARKSINKIITLKLFSYWIFTVPFNIILSMTLLWIFSVLF